MMLKNVKGKGKTRIQYAAIQRNGLLTRTYSIIIISDSLYNYVSCRLSSFSSIIIISKQYVTNFNDLFIVQVYVIHKHILRLTFFMSQI